MKYTLLVDDDNSKKSPPAWGRGLKCNNAHNPIKIKFVAPCVGAWVEIIIG